MSSAEGAKSSSSSNAIKDLPEYPTAPTTLEEKDKKMIVVLSAIELLKEIHDREDFISVLEVQQLREAFNFATGEKSTSLAGNNKSDNKGEKEKDDNNNTQISSALEIHYENMKTTADRLLTSLEAYAASKVVSLAGNTREGEVFWRRWQAIFKIFFHLLAESLVISAFNFFIGGSISLLLTALLLSNRYTAPFMLIYLFFIFTKGRPTFPVQKNDTFVRCRIWHYYRDYFPVRCFVPQKVREKLSREKNYLFLYHPHGILSFGAVLNFALDVNHLSETLPTLTIHLQTLKFNFWMPFFRHLLLWAGAGDASTGAVRRTLQKKNPSSSSSALLVLGGAEEAAFARPFTNELILKKRRGFVRIALQEGAALVPVYGFGENEVFERLTTADHPLVRRVGRFIKQLTGISLPLVKGVGLRPLRRPIIVVVGEPLELPKIDHPTDAEVDYWRAKYIAALQDLYEGYRGVYGLKSTGLRVVG